MSKIVPGDQWHTVADVARQLQMSQEWVRDRIKDGTLHAVKITDAGRGKYRISDTAIAAFMAHRATLAAAADAEAGEDETETEDGEGTG